jgi:hypothetical protein
VCGRSGGRRLAERDLERGDRRERFVERQFKRFDRSGWHWLKQWHKRFVERQWKHSGFRLGFRVQWLDRSGWHWFKQWRKRFVERQWKYSRFRVQWFDRSGWHWFKQWRKWFVEW